MKNLLPIITGFILVTNLHAQNEDIHFSNTIEIYSEDSKKKIIEKAAHVVPTSNQFAALQNEFIAFIHFGPNTFTRMEWGNGMEDPQIFELKELDTDQWCEALKSANVKMVILTVKHHDGFVLWQSRYTKHGIMSSPFKGGEGDILKELSESCRKYDLKLGIYLSPADLYQIENPKGLYGNLSKYTKRTIPHKISERPFKNKTTFEFVVDDYNEYFLNQLFELLTEYGPIHEVWFDGAHPKRKGGQVYKYAAWKELIKTLAPQAVIFGREDIRWCGNEAGRTRDAEWNIIPYAANPDTMSYFVDMVADDLGGREQLYKAKFIHYQQAETNTSIREGWFYRDDTYQRVRSADDVFDIYERAVGGNSTFLLNIPPNREGRFSAKDVEVLKETGERIRETYGTNLLINANGPEEVLDNKAETYIQTDEYIEIEMDRPVTFNRLLLQEAISVNSERVEEHTVMIWKDGLWKEIAHGTNIGYKRILRFPEVTTTKIRIIIDKSRLTPAISNVSAHYYQSRPPQLNFKRALNGMMTIEPLQQAFNWKAHGEDVIRNLNNGFKIYYTIDGTEPDETSIVYVEPFKMDKGILKAVAVLNHQKGAVHSEQQGLIKQEWSVSVSNKGADITKAFDADPDTYWRGADKLQFITIDLKKVELLKGFVYTPQKENGEGMMAKGNILVSSDNQRWEKAGEFEFGNLINDPTKRFHYFKKSVKARYVRIEPTAIAANGTSIAIAEIDLF